MRRHSRYKFFSQQKLNCALQVEPSDLSIFGF
jgi:hypothetical protein